MTGKDLQRYLDRLLSELPLNRYVERRFTAAPESDGVPVDMDIHFRGMLRDREPKLPDILKHTRVLLLAEPGGGKSIIARAAVHYFIRARERAPIFSELKEYRGDLTALMTKTAPPEILDPAASVEGKPLSRAYVLDGVDEIPRGLLPQLAADLQKLFDTDPEASVLLTARQAFFAAHRDMLPSITSLFHLLDFSDEDITEYVAQSNVDTNAFLAAVRTADATEEIRNPFILSVMIEKYREDGSLSDRRSDNLSYMIDRLIQSRRVNRQQQRRALKFLGVALETYSRNELTEEEAFRVIKQAMRISDADARSLLDDLYASILKRTANGLAFQMRSYGEFLAAEALEDEPVARVKELAFLDYNTPNDSWLNTVSYLVELNPRVRTYFVCHHLLWTISASPSAFPEEEKTTIVASALEICARERQYLLHHPLINVRRLSRFVTPSVEKALIANLGDQDDYVRGNAIVLLGILGRPEVPSIALSIIKDRSLGEDIRYCAVVALVHAGASRHVPELLAMRDPVDPIHVNLLDMIGAIIDESQIPAVLPLILRENAMLSATYYHFRELKSRDALIQTLRYCRDHPNDINTIRAEGYIEPIFELLPRFFDDEIARLCASFLETIETQHVYPDQSGPLPKLFEFMRKADSEGKIARTFIEQVLMTSRGENRRVYYVDQVLVSLITRQTAQWLIDINETGLIQRLAPFCRSDIRAMFRPYAGGLIEAQDASVQAYRDEQSKREESRSRRITLLQESLLSRTSLNDALKDFWELKEDYWPELPPAYRDWLASEVSKVMSSLDLEKTIQWKESTLWEPQVLSFLLQLINRYALKIAPDEPLVFVLTGLDTGFLAKYHQRSPLSETALKTLQRLLNAPASPRTLEGVVHFLESSEIWSPEIEASLMSIASSAVDQGEPQVTALRLLAKHGLDTALVEGILNTGANERLRNYAFEVLSERNHRPTIERALAQLGDDELKAANVGYPDSLPLVWRAKIKSDFAWDKLVTLRARALQLELPTAVGLITGTLANIDRKKTALLMRQQVDLAPQSWRTAQLSQAIEQERTARVEAAQRTPFDEVLKRLKGSTSINRFKVLCEGTSDRPVFKSLIDQIESVPEIIYGSVGGWSNLRSESDPNNWLLGCKEAMIIMDGDEGRRLTKRGKPYTKIAKEERNKLAGFPIELRILERYGIENYFPRKVLEEVGGTDLSAYFPIPDDVSVIEHLSARSKSWKYRVRKFLAGLLGLRRPSFGESLYSKNRNAESAQHLSLNDLSGTDLFDIIHDIARKANQLADE